MRSELEAKIADAVKQGFGVDMAIELTRPEEQFGDYATNVALQLAGRLQKNPREVADELAARLRADPEGRVSEVSVAGPGFINLKLTDETLLHASRQMPSRLYEGQEILVEFGDPNPFKEMHLGHLYAATAGDAIVHLFEASGATVHRLSYHGDVGMHVAKAIWAIRKHLNESPEQTIAEFFTGDTVIGGYYAEGARAFEEDPAAAEEIRHINASIYARDDEQINEIYDVGRDLSFKNFDEIFDELGIHYQKRYLESESTKAGLQLVQANLGGVFEQSDGAIIYRGEKAGLHTRVFVNSHGLPTYEAKDLGLVELKHESFPTADKSVIITANEQVEYFKVMLAALAEINPDLAAKTVHLSHGFLSLTTGKMSSRSGKVFAATDLLHDVRAAVQAQYPESAVQHEVYLAAVKYTFLKNRIGGDIVFDVQESVTLEGNSGPYLQYAHARARSILRKSQGAELGSTQLANGGLEPGERSLVRKLSEYPETVDKAVAELMPHYVTTYLYELAQTFNRFYEHSRVLGDPREALRLRLVNRYADVLRGGLTLLGIASPDQM